MNEMKDKKGFIIYLDLLGYRNIIQGNNQDEIDSLKKFIVDFTDTKAIEGTVGIFKGQFDPKKFLFRCYSDNFLLFYESESEIPNSDDLLTTCLLASYFLGVAIQRGYMLRGSIVFGTLTFNDSVVFGKDIVEAYQLEEGHIEPSLVLSPLLKGLYERDTLFNHEVLSPFACSVNDNYSHAEAYYKGMEILVRRLNLQSIVDERTVAKYRWLVEEYNRFFAGCATVKFSEGRYHFDLTYSDTSQDI